jgi:hypothetical protein
MRLPLVAVSNVSVSVWCGCAEQEEKDRAEGKVAIPTSLEVLKKFGAPSPPHLSLSLSLV